jgi:hypothetical protein
VFFLASICTLASYTNLIFRYSPKYLTISLFLKRQGCSDYSSVFGFLTHSDQFNPEIMQATKNIRMTNVGRRFRFSRTDIETVSGRTQNWLDSDGTVSGWNEPTLIGSGLQTAGLWWRVGKFNNISGG